MLLVWAKNIKCDELIQGALAVPEIRIQLHMFESPTLYTITELSHYPANSTQQGKINFISNR